MSEKGAPHALTTSPGALPISNASPKTSTKPRSNLCPSQRFPTEAATRPRARGEMEKGRRRWETSNGEREIPLCLVHGWAGEEQGQ